MSTNIQEKLDLKQIEFLNFAKDLAKIEAIEDKNEELNLLILDYDKSVFRNEKNACRFIDRCNKMLIIMENEFNSTELPRIRKNLDYISHNFHMCPKLIRTSKPNAYYQEKYQTDVYYLYLTNGEKEKLAKELLYQLILYKFSREGLDIIKEKYGIKNDMCITKLIGKVIYYEDLELLLASCGVEPDTEAYFVTDKFRYHFLYNLRPYIDKLVKATNDEEIDSIIQEISLTINISNGTRRFTSEIIREKIFKLGFYYLNNEEYKILKDKVGSYYNKKDEEYNSQLKQDEARSVDVENACNVLENYINKTMEISQEELVNNLTIIKRKDKDLYIKYIRIIYSHDAKMVIEKYKNSKCESLNEFLYVNNISLPTFNQYRLLLENDIDSEFGKKLRQDCLRAYDELSVTTQRLIDLMNGEYYNYALMVYILNESKISFKTLCLYLQSMRKKDNITFFEIQRYTKLLKIINKYLKELELYSNGREGFYKKFSSFMEYSGIKITTDLRNEAIAYLITNDIDVNYNTVRSIIISYIKKGQFNLEEKNKIKILNKNN